MGIATGRDRQALRTTTGTQTFTDTALGGLTPKAAIVILTNATALNTVTSHAHLSVGFAVGTTEVYVGGASEHGQATSDCTRARQNDAVAKIFDPGTTTADLVVTVDSWTTDGIVLSVDTADLAYQCEVILFAGSDLSAEIANNTLGNTTGDQAISASFEPDLIFSAWAAGNNEGAASAADLEIAYGVIHNDGAGTVTQRFVTTRERNGRTTSNGATFNRDDAGSGEILSMVTIDWWGDYQDFTATGYNINVNNRGANSSRVYNLHLAFGGAVGAAVWTLNTPTSTGLATDGGPNFEPQLAGYIQQKDAVDTGAVPFTLAYSAFTADGGSTISAAAENGQATTDTQSVTSDDPVYLADGDGTLDLRAAFSSMESTGPRLNWSTVDTSARPLFGWAIEAEAGGETINFTATAAAVTSTPAAIATITRNLTATAAAATNTPAAIATIFRDLTATAAAATNTPAAIATIFRDLTATAAAATNTPAAIATIFRDLTATAAAATNTPAAIATIFRDLTATAAAATNTPPADLTVGGVVSFTATAAAATNTPAAIATIFRDLTATAAAATNTPPADLTVGGVVSFTATAAAATNTPAAIATIFRDLTATAAAATNTPPADLTVAGVVSFTATAAAATNTPAAIATIFRDLTATAAAATNTPPAEMMIGGVVSFTATAAAATNTPAAALAVTRDLAAVALAATNTAAAALAVTRDLAAVALAATNTPAAELTIISLDGLIYIVFTAARPGATFTAARPGATFTAARPGINIEAVD